MFIDHHHHHHHHHQPRLPLPLPLPLPLLLLLLLPLPLLLLLPLLPRPPRRPLLLPPGLPSPSAPTPSTCRGLRPFTARQLPHTPPLPKANSGRS